MDVPLKLNKFSEYNMHIEDAFVANNKEIKVKVAPNKGRNQRPTIQQLST